MVDKCQACLDKMFGFRFFEFSELTLCKRRTNLFTTTVSASSFSHHQRRGTLINEFNQRHINFYSYYKMAPSRQKRAPKQSTKLQDNALGTPKGVVSRSGPSSSTLSDPVASPVRQTVLTIAQRLQNDQAEHSAPGGTPVPTVPKAGRRQSKSPPGSRRPKSTRQETPRRSPSRGSNSPPQSVRQATPPRSPPSRRSSSPPRLPPRSPASNQAVSPPHASSSHENHGTSDRPMTKTRTRDPRMAVSEIAPKPTVAEYIGEGRMLVKTEKIEHSARECACYNSCGAMIRCGTYGKEGDLGKYGCAHCTEYGSKTLDKDGNRKIFPSYAEHKKHVLRNKKCLLAQNVDPKRLPPLQILGRGLECKLTTEKTE